ncbi:nuclear transport factor 2 family protein [Tsukamurella pulmonis]|uniref:nuclear transport factor 2 family protein n=1 Tax=Tsukamurella pulmonis TaxID=47312 RepID=UPI0009E6AE8B
MTSISAQVHTDVAQLYSRHMRAMDEGRVTDWTADFTDSATFTTNARPDTQEGRCNIATEARDAANKLRDSGDRRRHCLTNLELCYVDGDTTRLRADSYAVVVRTPQGGPSAVEFLCTCTDYLVFEAGRWSIERRVVQRDDLPRLPTEGAI